MSRCYLRRDFLYMLRGFTIVSAGCLTILGLPAVSSSAPLRIPESVYPYSVVEQDISIVLREFGQNMGIGVKVSPKVAGIVKGKIPRLPGIEFLNYLCKMYGLEWYFDGTSLHVSNVSESQTRFLRLHPQETTDNLLATLKNLNFYDDRYPVRPGPDQTSVVVSGPPAYVTLVEQTLSMSTMEVPTQTKVYRGASVSVEKFSEEERAQASR